MMRKYQDFQFRTIWRMLVLSTGLFLLLLPGYSVSFGADDPRIKPLLREALRLYSERQYVRSLDLFKKVELIDPKNSTAKEYIESAQQRILEWESQGSSSGSGREGEKMNWDSLLNNRRSAGGVGNITNAKDIIAARRSLVQRMKNRSVNTDNIVEIEDRKRGMRITLYHDQLFLPGLQTLRDESLPILANLADLIRTSGEREVSITSMAHSDSEDPYLLFPEFPVPAPDPTLPRMRHSDVAAIFQDIEATRAFILFTHLAQQSMKPRGDSQNP